MLSRVAARGEVATIEPVYEGGFSLTDLGYAALGVQEKIDNRTPYRDRNGSTTTESMLTDILNEAYDASHRIAGCNSEVAIQVRHCLSRLTLALAQAANFDVIVEKVAKII
jgi:hypothetical protein